MDIVDNEDAERDALRELAEGEFKVNEKGKRILEYIAANIGLQDFAESLTQEVWLREVLKDVSSTNPFIRQRALAMWGQHMNWLGKKSAKEKDAVQGVEFE